MAEFLPGTAIAVGGHAVLIRGVSGVGKSDLALRCLAVPCGPFATAEPKLVADDQVEVVVEHGRAMLRAPATIAGRIEVRGLGIVMVPFVAEARLVLVADIVAADAIERMPADGPTTMLCGIKVPSIQIAALQPSAPLKLLLALAAAAQTAQVQADGPDR